MATRVRTLLTDKCYHCHGDAGAEKDVYVLDYERLIRDRVLVPNDLASKLFTEVEAKRMPADGDLTETDVGLLRVWIEAGAPPWPSAAPERQFIPEREVHRRIVADLQSLPERDRAYTRYFSIVHLYNADMSDEELESTRTGLSKLVNSLSWQRKIVVPMPIDKERVTLRIDLRSYDWVTDTWAAVLARYPYGVAFVDVSDVTRLSGSRLPYVRADWFVATASVPPLYHDILKLPTTVAALEQKLEVDPAKNLAQEHGVGRAGVRKSGVSRNNRVVERHDSTFGAYWKSHDFSSSAGEQDIFRNPLDFKAAGGEMVFNLPNGLQAYFVADQDGNRLDEAPTAIVSNRVDPSAPEVRNGLTCMSCHFQGIKPFEDEVRSVMLASTGSSPLQRSKVLALYWDTEQMNAAIAEDTARFKAAVERTGGHLGGSHKSEPVTMLARRFQGDLTISHAAAELGLGPDEMQKRLTDATGNAGFPQLLAQDGGVKRDQWEVEFRRVAQAIAGAKPVVEAAPSPTPKAASPVAAPASALAAQPLVAAAAPPAAPVAPPVVAAAPPPPSRTALAPTAAGAAAGAAAAFVQPTAPPAPTLPVPSGPTPSCNSAPFLGDWLVTTRVFRGSERTAAGVNGYYSFRISGSGCQLSAEVVKVAYSSAGSIKPFKDHQRQSGTANLEVKPGAPLATLEIRLARPDQSGVQETELALLASAGRLEGAWNYAGAGWFETKMRGTLLGQRRELGYPTHRAVSDVGCLPQCVVECDVARPDEVVAADNVERAKRCVKACVDQPNTIRTAGCNF